MDIDRKKINKDFEEFLNQQNKRISKQFKETYKDNTHKIHKNK